MPVLFAVVALAAMSTGSSAQALRTSEQLAKLKERDDSYAKAQKFIEAGDFSGAIDSSRKAFAAEREALPTDHLDVLQSLEWIARLCALNDNLEGARQRAQEALAVQLKGRDESHWRVASARRTLTYVERLSKLNSQQRKQLREAEQLNAQALAQQKYELGVPLATRALELHKQVLGDDSADYATSQLVLGRLYFFLNDFEKAEPLLRQAMERREKLQGTDHPDYLLSLNVYAQLHTQRQQYKEAEALFRQLADAYRRGGDELESEYAQILNSLAEIYVRTRELRRAETLRREVVEIRKRLNGETHVSYAEALNGVANVLTYQGEFASAEPLVKQALEIMKLNGKLKDPKYTNYLENLSYIYAQQGKLDEALPLELQTLELLRETWGPQHPRTSIVLHRVSSIYIRMKNFDKALEYSRQTAAAYRVTFKDKDPRLETAEYNVAWVLENVAEQALRREDFAEALKANAEAMEIQTKLYGQDHYLVTDARLTQEFYAQLKGMTPEQRKQLDEAERNWLKAGEVAKSNLREALLLAEGALETRRKLLTDEHWVTLNSWNQVSHFYKELGDLAKAKPFYFQMPELYRKVRGERHLQTIQTVHNLAGFHETLGDFTRATALYEKALDDLGKVVGENDTRFANTLNSLAVMNANLGLFGKAEAFHLRALAIRKRIVGEKHEDYAQSLLNLGNYYESSLGDYAKAEPLLLQAVESYRSSVGEQHPDYARSLDVLALLYIRLKQYDRAQELFERSLAIRKETLGENHLLYSVTLHNLGLMYEEMSDYERAEPLLLKALAIGKESLGESHPGNAVTLTELATVYLNSARYPQALEMAKQALDIRKATLGEHDPDHARSLSQVGIVTALTGDPTSGADSTLEAVRIARNHLERNAAFQSERQQLIMRQTLSRYVNNHLFVAAMAKLPAESVYAEVLGWKGVVGARQQQTRRILRQLKESGDAQAVKLAVELENATATLAELSAAIGARDPERTFRIEEISDRIESLQKELAKRSVDLQQQLAQQHRTPDEIRRVLPSDTVLIDLIIRSDFRSTKPGSQERSWQSALTAFVVRPNKPVERIDLGLTEPVETEIEAWRRSFGRKTGDHDPGIELRRLIWQPLEKYLSGARVVLVSPSGLLATMPWAALPGKKLGTYLIDEVAVAVVPIPTLLPELLADDGKKTLTVQDTSLLLVGDVDFGADPAKIDPVTIDRIAARGGAPTNWSALPGTRDEVADIASAFAKRFGNSKPTELTRDRATKTAVRSAIGKHQFLHFSTHGFFAAPEVRSAQTATLSDRTSGSSLSNQSGASGYHPGLLSGLVLAGANRPLETGKSDGILTALEVGEMDLNQVQLATLSACETGLGQSAGGEGLLGLQRAFQSAGAKTVVAGLWKVPDKATQLLMSRFYDNLWKRKMTKLEALREAQLWMIRQAPRQPELLRGLDVDPQTEQDVRQSGTLSPQYWGAFVLSGDWR